jgi:hypothetical protein
MSSPARPIYSPAQRRTLNNLTKYSGPLRESVGNSEKRREALLNTVGGGASGSAERAGRALQIWTFFDSDALMLDVHCSSRSTCQASTSMLMWKLMLQTGSTSSLFYC